MPGRGGRPVRKPIIVAAAVLLMVLAMAVDPASGAVSFGGTLQEPVMDTVPDFQR